ncbi:unnamed protein product, partial [Staurois parvus]
MHVKHVVPATGHIVVTSSGTLGRRIHVVPALTGILLHYFPLSGRTVHLGTWLLKATGWLFIFYH